MNATFNMTKEKSLDSDNMELNLPKNDKSVLSKADTFNEIVEYRRAVRIYDHLVKFDPEVVMRSLERALLAPNSSNLQLWEFHRIQSQEALAKMTEYCLGQSAAKTANELVVVVVRNDKARERMRWNYDLIKQSIGDRIPNAKEKDVLNYYGKLLPFVYANDYFNIWGKVKNLLMWGISFVRPIMRKIDRNEIRIMGHKSAALAAQTFMLSLAAEGYDSCPMEGIDAIRIRKFLGLPRKAEVSMVISVGIRKSEGVYASRSRVDSKDVIFEH
ncbi:MAG: nitroreductase family protein [Bacteroidota bacterium]|nr:nitroreductase family protein [Bacteroidota bacterium]